VPVLKTAATTGEGVAALADAIEDVARGRAGDARERRRRRARYLIARAAAEGIARRIKEGGGRELDALADKVLAGALTPEDAAAGLLLR
jgi:LAO/AO transport system kinase